MNNFILSCIISTFPVNVAFTPRKKASSLCKLKMAMKQQTMASFQFNNLSHDQDKLSTNTLGENTNTCLPSISDAHGPQKTQ